MKNYVKLPMRWLFFSLPQTEHLRAIFSHFVKCVTMVHDMDNKYLECNGLLRGCKIWSMVIWVQSNDEIPKMQSVLFSELKLINAAVPTACLHEHGSHCWNALLYGYINKYESVSHKLTTTTQTQSEFCSIHYHYNSDIVLVSHKQKRIMG